MNNNLLIKQFYGDEAGKLVAELKAFFESHDQSQAAPRFALLWGPPGASLAEIDLVAQEIPDDIPLIGCSAAELIFKSRYVTSGGWSVVVMESKYITPHCSHCSLEPDAADHGNIHDRLSQMLDGFPAEVRRRYFNGGRPLGLEGCGVDGVPYRRPAVMITFLPGMGLDDGSGWPSNNRDYEIIDYIAGEVSWNLGVTGGTAVGQWRKDATWAEQWLAARRDGKLEVYRDGVVALLFETDLNFGIAAKHGFITGKETYQVKENYGAKPAHVIAPDGQPMRFHEVEIELPEDVPKLRPPTEAGVKSTDFDEQDVLRFLMTWDHYEDLPNPPYFSKPEENNRWQLSRPIAKGGVLFSSEANLQSLRACPADSIKSAIELGSIGSVAGILAIDCRGRLDFLTEEDVSSVAKSLSDGWGEKVVGYGADGETASTSRRIPLHRNWTFSSLVLGAGLSRRYLAAAERVFFSALNLQIARDADESEVHKKIVEIASKLLQIDDCHLRIYSPPKRELVKVAGVGAWQQKVPRSVPTLVDEGVSAQKAFLSKSIVARKGIELSEDIDRFAHHLNVDRSELAEELNRLKWFISIPILDHENTDCLGVLSFASEDEHYVDALVLPPREELGERKSERADPTYQRMSMAWTIATTVASSIRAFSLSSARERFLINASMAGDSTQLAKELVKEGAYFLGHNAYLSLLLPTADGNTLECIDISGPTPVDPSSVHVKITPDSKSGDIGISGYVYRTGEPWPNETIESDDLRKEANGKGGRPKFKDCLGVKSQIAANYAVPIIGKSRKVLGVLNAEAPEGVLNRPDIRQLTQLAGICAPVIERHMASRREESSFRGESSLSGGGADDLEGPASEEKKSLWHHVRDTMHITDRQFRAVGAFLVVLIGVYLVASLASEVSARNSTLRLLKEKQQTSRSAQAPDDRLAVSLEEAVFGVQTLIASGTNVEGGTLREIVVDMKSPDVSRADESLSRISAFSWRTWSSVYLLTMCVILSGCVGHVVGRCVVLNGLFFNASSGLAVSFGAVSALLLIGSLLALDGGGAMEHRPYACSFLSFLAALVITSSPTFNRTQG